MSTVIRALLLISVLMLPKMAEAKCAFTFPTKFVLVENEKGTDLYVDKEKTLTAAVKCHAPTESIEQTMADLKVALKGSHIERMSDSSFYFDVALNGVVTRSYFLFSTSEVTQVSFISNDKHSDRLRETKELFQHN